MLSPNQCPDIFRDFSEKNLQLQALQRLKSSTQNTLPRFQPGAKDFDQIYSELAAKAHSPAGISAGEAQALVARMLHFRNAHWPSWMGGSREANHARIEAAQRFIAQDTALKRVERERLEQTIQGLTPQVAVCLSLPFKLAAEFSHPRPDTRSFPEKLIFPKDPAEVARAAVAAKLSEPIINSEASSKNNAALVTPKVATAISACTSQTTTENSNLPGRR